MSVPRLLLLTAVSPGCYSVGAVFLRDMIARYPQDHIACGVLEDHGEPGGSSTGCLPWLRKASVRVSRATFRGKPGSLVARLDRRRSWAELRGPIAAEASAALADIGRQAGANMVCAVLNHPLLFSIAPKVASSIGAPLATIVFDPPQYQIRRAWPDAATHAALMAAFSDTVRSSVRVGVISRAMGDAFEAAYGATTLVIRHGFGESDWYAPRSQPHHPHRLKIGFAGQLYADDAWQALQRDLADAAWQVNDRCLAVTMIGGGMPAHVGSNAAYELYGWRSQAEVLGILAECDIAYLPYWFDGAFADVVQLSFPGKLSAYVAAGLPVLYHGPGAAAVASYMHETGLGVTCTTLEPGAVIDSLAELARPEAYRRAAEAADTTRKRDLGQMVLQRRFADLVGIDAACFVGPPDPVCNCPLGRTEALRHHAGVTRACSAETGGHNG